MILICSLIGKEKKFYLKNNFFYKSKEKLNYFEYLQNTYSFCKKIYILTDNLKFKKKQLNRISFHYIRKTNNQCQSLYTLKEKIKNNEKVIIANPDALYKISQKKFLTNNDIVLYAINKNDIRRNFGKKDTYEVSKTSNLISKINLKSKKFKKKI